MKIIKYVLVLILCNTLYLYAQITYSGPATGTVDTGVVRTTDDFTRVQFTPNLSLKLINHEKPSLLPTPAAELSSVPPEGSNFILDPNYNKLAGVDDSVIIFEEFEGYKQSNSIPPDPYLAVGPNHIIFTVNSSFKITDKQGNELKSISAAQWYSTLVPGASPFDPKVIYDHYSGRWVMVWLHINESASEGYYLFSVSDDSDPLGTWYNWALPSNVDGSTVNGSWGDYEGLGFDDKAIYLTSNQFYFSGGYSNTKLRIILKSEIYKDNAGPVNFTDIWNIKYPSSTANAFGLRPVRMYSKSDNYYFVAHSPFTVGTNFAIYTLSQIERDPVLSGDLVPVTAFSQPPDMDQLGGGTPRIDGGGFGLRNEPVYKNGKIHLVHSVRVVNNGAFSGVHYVEIDLSNNTAITDFVMGAPSHYHSYPALVVDGSDNVVITYSRSAKDDYAGAYFTIIPAGSQTPTGSFVMQSGKDNYVVTYGGTRNRWGDYNGAWLDPVDTNSVWLYTEYVHHKNNWGTWASGVRFEPFTDQYIFSHSSSLDLGEVEIGTDTLREQLIIRNFGQPVLNISQISVNRSDVINLTFSKPIPADLNAFDSLVINIEFIPAYAEIIQDSIIIESNDPDDPIKVIPISAIGYEIIAAEENVIYASSAPINTSGKYLKLSEVDATPTEVGDLGFPGIISLTINPLNNFVYGLKKEINNSKLVVINSSGGDAHLITEFPIPFVSITFDNNGKLYGFTVDRNIYELSLNGDTTHLAQLSKNPSAIAVNPVDNQLWMFSRTGLNNGKLYKVDPTTGTEEEVASVDLNPNDLAFDSSGELFAVYGSRGKLVSIDPLTGLHFDVGTVGIQRVKGLTIRGDVTVTSVNNQISDIPAEFEVKQNYPNPFNPTTIINFALPSRAEVTISLYNILGQEITTIVKKEFAAGYNSVEFDGSQLSSGTYIYKIKAVSDNGESYVATKKMVLLK